MAENRLEVARTIALKVGVQLIDGAGKPREVRQKGSSDDLVTEYDLLSERLIVEAILAQFPDDAIISEEEAGSQEQGYYTWYIDPIDGTTNFAHGLPLYSISIACHREGEPYLGLIYNPMHKEMFDAQRGEGAHLNGREISVSKTEKLESSLLATDFPPNSKTDLETLNKMARVLQEKARDLRRLGSAALHLAYVAAGRLDGYYEFPLSSWDWAAGALIVHEAGGKVTDLTGNRSQEMHNAEVVASNGFIHDELLSLLEQARNQA